MVKTLLRITLGIITFFSTTTITAQNSDVANSQEVEKESPFTIGVDLVSAYVCRGTKFSGPAIQPRLEYDLGGFGIGTWGSFDFVNGFNELDTYASYTFDFGLGLGLTDYYYQGSRAFDFADSTGSHALEINLNYVISQFSFSANYVINDTHAGKPGTKGGDVYFEADYDFKYFKVFLGAGNGWNTADANFNVCNVGIEVKKDIKINETFSIPVFAQLVVNPDKAEYDLIVGFSL